MNEVAQPKANVRSTLTNLPAMKIGSGDIAVPSFDSPQNLAHKLLSEEKFARRVRKAEEEAQKDFTAYRRKVFLFALVGCLYVAFVPVILTAVFALLVWHMATTGRMAASELQIVIGLFCALTTYVFALWIPFEKPTGTIIKREECPELFKLLDELSEKLRIKIDYVMVDSQFNAMVSQYPRFRFLGGYQNYIVLGLPLMMAMPPQHLKAILAHEFGHLSGNHGKGNAFIYNQRVRLRQALYSMHKHSMFASAWVKLFYDWYYPRFSADSLVIAREHEKQADRQAIEFTDAKICGEAFILTAIKSSYLQQIWEEIKDKIKEDPTPPGNAFQIIGEKLSTAPTDKAKAITALNKTLSAQTDREDTHPALTDRLQSAQFPIENLLAESLYNAAPLDFGLESSAAGVYLGNKLQPLINHYSDIWYNETSFEWRAIYFKRQEANQELLKLEQKAQKEELTLDELVQIARLTGIGGRTPETLLKYQNVLARDPQNSEARYIVGAMLLDTDEQKAIQVLKAQAAESNEYGLYACAELNQYFNRKQMSAAAREIQNIILAKQKFIDEAKAERKQLTARDPVIPHDLAQGAIDSLVEILSKHETISEAYLYCKSLQHLPQEKFYILVVVPTQMSLKQLRNNITLEEKLKEKISLPFTSSINVICRSYANWLRDKAADIPNALIYKR